MLKTLGEISDGFEKIRKDFAELLMRRDALDASTKGVKVEEARQALIELGDHRFDFGFHLAYSAPASLGDFILR